MTIQPSAQAGGETKLHIECSVADSLQISKLLCVSRLMSYATTRNLAEKIERHKG